MTRKSNKDNLVEHPEIDKLEKLLRKQRAKEMADEPARAHAAEVARANEEGRDPPPPQNLQDPAGDVDRGIRSSPFLSLILQVHRSEVVNGYRTRGPDCTLQTMIEIELGQKYKLVECNKVKACK
ncbi:unnamed protein product [Microthlaspi erraticum]|uniref:Uncharacterized protein n=1 Tax=Microthlaspi erraticum TaxID=1685480 RepID=A0A6D2JUT2_9BRAS|nr:unnamed protein product [Microthlaspi erraticum]